MFSGIISRVGTLTTFPSICDGFHSNQSNVRTFAVKESEIASKDFDFSRTLIRWDVYYFTIYCNVLVRN